MLKEKFLEYFKSERNCSPLTVASYGSDLDELLESMKYVVNRCEVTIFVTLKQEAATCRDGLHAERIQMMKFRMSQSARLLLQTEQL